MAIDAQNARNDYLADGVVRTFDFTFALYKPAAETQIYLFVCEPNGEATRIESGFSIDMENRVLTYPASGLEPPIEAGKIVVIARALPIVQDTDLTSLPAYHPKYVEQGLDYRTLIEQQINDNIKELFAGFNFKNVSEWLERARTYTDEEVAKSSAADRAYSDERLAERSANDRVYTDEQVAASSIADRAYSDEKLAPVKAITDLIETDGDPGKFLNGEGEYLPVTGPGIDNDHDHLANRAMEGQHPISAISGLTEDLAAKELLENKETEIPVAPVSDDKYPTSKAVREAISAASLAVQIWLPAVDNWADLPEAADENQNYLCRVIKDAAAENNGVWQWIGGSGEWTYFSDNLDFVDETELEAAMAEVKITTVVYTATTATLTSTQLRGGTFHKFTNPITSINITSFQTSDKPIHIQFKTHASTACAFAVSGGTAIWATPKPATPLASKGVWYEISILNGVFAMTQGV